MSAQNPRFRRDNPALPTTKLTVYRVRFVCNFNGQFTSTIFWYDNGQENSVATRSEMQALVTALTNPAALAVKFQNCCSSDLTMTQIIIDSPTSPTVNAWAETQARVGTAVDKTMPAQTAVTILRGTTMKGQCGRGRISVPAVPTTWVTRFELTNDVAHKALRDFMQVAMTVGGVTFTPGLFSYGSRTHPTWGYLPLSYASLDYVLGTCRTRKPGVGK